MPEEKAALLVRKFFGNSIIESKKSRMAQTETIAEESSEPEVSTSSSLPVGASPNHVTRTQLVTAEQSATGPLPESQPEVLVDSFDSDELFRLCGASDFGSSRDALDMDDDDADDDGSLSFRTTASTLQRYSSCSERSVRLSDIINRPDPPSASTSAPSPVARATTCVNTSVLPPVTTSAGEFHSETSLVDLFRHLRNRKCRLLPSSAGRSFWQVLPRLRPPPPPPPPPPPLPLPLPQRQTSTGTRPDRHFRRRPNLPPAPSTSAPAAPLNRPRQTQRRRRRQRRQLRKNSNQFQLNFF